MLGRLPTHYLVVPWSSGEPPARLRGKAMQYGPHHKGSSHPLLPSPFIEAMLDPRDDDTVS